MSVMVDWPKPNSDSVPQPATTGDGDRERPAKLYRLKVIDVNGNSYNILGTRSDVGGALDWLTTDVGEEWLDLRGFDDEADRKPLRVVVSRSTIVGMMLSRV